MADLSPAVAQRALAARLRQIRIDRGTKGQDLSKRLGFSRNYWSAVEHSRALLADDKLRRFIEIYELEDEVADELLSLREQALAPRWWMEYAPLVDDAQLDYYGLEDGAVAIRNYEALIITGLLQTERYARTLIETAPTNAPATFDRRVELRMRRQARLLTDDGPQLTALFSEAALMQQVGGAEVQAEQLQHLLDVAANPSTNVELRVVPFTESLEGLTGSSTLHLMDFPPQASLRTVAYREASITVGHSDSSETIRLFEDTYAQGLAASLDPPASRRRIEALLVKLRHSG